jgi:hypothetical protein
MLRLHRRILPLIPSLIEEKSIAAKLEGRVLYDERMRASGAKFPWGRKKKGTPRLVLVGKALLESHAGDGQAVPACAH